MFKRANPTQYTSTVIGVFVIFAVLAALLWVNNTDQKVELFMVEGNPAFLAAYETLDTKPLGCGAQACTWTVIKKGDPTKTVRVAKIYKRSDTSTMFFQEEVAAMRLIGNHEGYSNLIESFEDAENGSVIV